MSVRQISDKLESAEVQKICLRNDVSPYGEVLTRQEIEDTVAQVIDRMYWRGTWVDGTLYNLQDCVRDGNYLMVANKQTYDRPAPVPVGSPYYWYQGTGMLPQTATGIKQLVFGTRYSNVNPYSLEGYRIDVVAGNDYEVIIVQDPLGSAQATFVNSFTADVDGRRTFGLVPEVIAAGTTFDLLVIVSQPDPAPATFTGDWSYSKPQNISVPVSGAATQATNNSALLYIHSRDQLAADRTTELQSLVAGDKIVLGSDTWAIQSVSEVGVSPDNYFIFGVSPAVQSPTTGVQTFTFETTTPVDISYVQDTDYYLGQTQAKGLYVEDGDHNDVVQNDNAYGVDIFVQEVSVSADWDFMAITEGLGGGASTDKIYKFTKVSGHVVASVNPAWEEVVRVEVAGAPAGTYEYKISMTYTLNSTTTSAFVRFSIDNGVTWNEFRAEPKDVTDARAEYYAFPIVYSDTENLNLIIEASKEVGGDVMTIDFIDVIIDQKA